MSSQVLAIEFGLAFDKFTAGDGMPSDDDPHEEAVENIESEEFARPRTCLPFENE